MIVAIACAKFYQNRAENVENMSKILFPRLNYLWVLLHRFSRNSQTLILVTWIYFVSNLSHIAEEMQNEQVETP